MASGKEVLEHAFRETAKGNGRPFVDMLADDVEWSIIGSTEWSETFRGKSSVIADLLGPFAQRESRSRHRILRHGPCRQCPGSPSQVTG
jgi:uncharacterized protein